jgi:hypothetical protein
LSYPDHLSINDGIPQDKCTVQYHTIDDAISLVKYHGEGRWKPLYSIYMSLTMNNMTGVLQEAGTVNLSEAPEFTQFL